MKAQDILIEIQKLSKSEQTDLYEVLYPIIFKSSDDMTHYIKDIWEAKFSGTPQCPYCGCEHIKVMVNTEVVSGTSVNLNCVV